jgi:hypothetical protein
LPRILCVAYENFAEAMRVSSLDELTYSMQAGITWAHFRASALIAVAASDAIVGRAAPAQPRLAHPCDVALISGRDDDFENARA